MGKRSAAIILFLTLLSVFTISGCGSPKPTPTPVTPSPIPIPSSPTPMPIVGAQSGGTLNLMSREDPKHFDVHQEVSPALISWGPGIVYSRLLRFRSGPEVQLPSLAVECDLCEGWIQLDPKTYVFRLRSGIRWQDVPPVNGRLLTAEDVVFSYNRQRTPGWPNASLLRAIESMAVVDDLTLKITLLAPDADFLFSLADGHSKIVAKEAVEAAGDLKDGPNIGTGPWLWLSTEADLGSSFERNPGYFEEDFPFLDKLSISVIKDAETRLAAFKTRVVDIHQMGPREWEEFREDRPNASSLMYPEPGTGLELAINTSRPPFDDLRVRRALFKAMDPWKANEEIWAGKAFVSLGSPIAEAQWLLAEEELKGYFQDPEEAKELLTQSGVDLPVQVELMVGDFGDEYLRYGERVAEELRAVGFEASIMVRNVIEFAREVWYGGDYTVFLGEPPPAATPNFYLLPIFHSEGAWNSAAYRDRDLDRLLEDQAKELDPGVRRALILDIQRKVFDRAFRFMSATRISTWTWWPRVNYFYPNFAASEYFHWARVWVEE